MMEGMKLIGSIFAAGTLCFLSSCSLVQQQSQATDTPAPEAVKTQEKKDKKVEQKAESTVQPTPEQMETAMEMIQQDKAESTDADEKTADAVSSVSEAVSETISEAVSETTSEPASETPAGVVTEATPQPEVIPGGLRMGRFAPPEEAVSSSENDDPAPNSVELHGFRSPNLKGGKLPMNINGKINKPE